MKGKEKPRYGGQAAKTNSESRRTFTGISLVVCENVGFQNGKNDFWTAQQRPLKAATFHITDGSSLWSPSTMLVLAKKPDEVFKAPLKTKKQAPVTARDREKHEPARTAPRPRPTSTPPSRQKGQVSPLRGW